MNGASPDLSEQLNSEPGEETTPAERGTAGRETLPTEDLNAALDRLRSRIEEVAEWAERASIPAAPEVRTSAEAIEQPAEPGRGPVEPSQEKGHEEHEAEGGAGGAAQAEPAPSPVLSFIQQLAGSGKVSSAIFVAGGEAPDWELNGNGLPPGSSLLALLGLVPPETVLEIRTTSGEWRAARIGEEAFVLELGRGGEPEVDEWLATLLPLEED